MRTRWIIFVAAALLAACGDDSESPTQVGSGEPEGTEPEEAELEETEPEEAAEDPDEIDGAAAREGLDAVIDTARAEREDDYPAVDLEQCAMGDQGGHARTAAQVANVFEVFEGVTSDGSTHAWANPDGDTPGTGCWVAPYTAAGEPEGAAEVHVYARAIDAEGYEGSYPSETRGRGDGWTVYDESVEAYGGGELHAFCWHDTSGISADDCGAHWAAEESGIVLVLELYGSDDEGSVNAQDTNEAMRLLLPNLASSLAANALGD